VLEVSREPEVAPEPVPTPEVVAEEVPVEGAMITACTVAPSPSHGTPASLSPAPRITVARGAASVAGLEVVLGHPTPYSADNIPLGEVVSMAHRALSQVQRVLRRKGEDLTDEHRRLQLWASMLKRMMVTKRAAAWARQDGFNLQVEIITNATPTPSMPLPTCMSCAHRPRPGPVLSSSRRRTLPCAHARSTSGCGRWKSWRGSCKSERAAASTGRAG
jgi:hypothetical protein